MLLFQGPEKDPTDDLAWDKIRHLPRDEPLYQYLNKLRVLRLKNRFEELLPEMSVPLDHFGARREHEEIGDYARNLLFLETCFTRSEVADVLQGIALGEQLYRKYRRDPTKLRQLTYILSILYQQLATVKFLGGNVRLARELQDKALRYDQKARTRFVDNPLTTTLGAALRTRTVARRYGSHEVSEEQVVAWQERILDSSRIQATNDYRYLLDVAFGMEKLSAKLGESLYETTNTLVDFGGYGSERNIALCVSLRRRWWILHLCHEKQPDLDLLQKDLQFWHGVNMKNEVRELYSLVLRARGRILDNYWREVVEMVTV